MKIIISKKKRKILDYRKGKMFFLTSNAKEFLIEDVFSYKRQKFNWSRLDQFLKKIETKCQRENVF